MVARPRWQPSRTRLRIHGSRHTGSVLQWKDRFGWIQPDWAIDHPEASKHGWRVYLNAKDVEFFAQLYEGARVSFYAYSDGDGLGAEEVRLEADADLEGGVARQVSAPAKPLLRPLGAKAGSYSGKGGGGKVGCGKVGCGKGVGGVLRTIEKPTSVTTMLAKRPALCAAGLAKGKLKGTGKSKNKVLTPRPVVLAPRPKAGSKGGGGGTGDADRNKTTLSGGQGPEAGGVLVWASSELRGWRPAMEDASCALLGLDSPLDTHAMFAIFDGHGGAAVSRQASAELPAEVHLAAVEALAAEESGALDLSSEEGGLAGKALKEALPAMDAVLREAGEGQEGTMQNAGPPITSNVRNAFALTGSTAVVALLECAGTPEVSPPLRITVANCGDSRAILCRAGEAVALSEDHKPDDPIERARIMKAGGFVGAVGPCQRIDGWGLNLSRALGDFHYKAREDLSPAEQKVSVIPDIRTCEITEEDEFLLLCCDGVFELYDNQQAVDIVRERLLDGAPLTEAIESLVDASCSPDLQQTMGRGSDNVSAMVVLLREGPPPSGG